MAVYTIHMRGEGLDAARGAVFVREGFSKGAFFFGVFWLLRHRLWLASMAWVLAVVALVAATSVLTSTASFALFLLLGLLTGLEAQALRRRALVRNGYPACDIVAASDRDSAERRFFARLGDEPAPMPARAAPAGRPGAAPVLGLFPEAEGRT
jgi:hypothetical protein